MTTAVRPTFKDIVNFGGSFSPRFGARVCYALGHTQEGPGDAYSLAAYCRNPANNASYHDIIDNFTCIAIVDTDDASWSVLNANPRAYNFCYAGSRASWTREEWIRNMRNGIRISAWKIVENLAKYPYLKAIVQARPYPKGDIACVADHYFVTRVLGIGTHTDLGPHYPFDLLEADIRMYLGMTSPKPLPAPVNRINERAAKASDDLFVLGARVKTGRENAIGEVVTPDGRGRWAKFENGYVYWSPTTGAVAMPDEIFDVWKTHGFEGGALGYPTVERTELDGGLVQAFERGVIYRRHGSDIGFYVHGIIGTRWAREGYEEGPLGWPISNEYSDGNGGRRQDFEHGSLLWDPSGAVKVAAVKVVMAA
ncbi:hypothetical protein [Gordonia malaquae]|uniref:LGFP repeat-containing protein n=1 Tax=Gordonia malaquae TaxID=410332 RepID=UPI003016A0A2